MRCELLIAIQRESADHPCAVAVSISDVGRWNNSQTRQRPLLSPDPSAGGFRQSRLVIHDSGTRARSASCSLGFFASIARIRSWCLNHPTKITCREPRYYLDRAGRETKITTASTSSTRALCRREGQACTCGFVLWVNRRRSQGGGLRCALACILWLSFASSIALASRRPGHPPLLCDGLSMWDRDAPCDLCYAPHAARPLCGPCHGQFSPAATVTVLHQNQAT